MLSAALVIGTLRVKTAYRGFIKMPHFCVWLCGEAQEGGCGVGWGRGGEEEGSRMSLSYHHTQRLSRMMYFQEEHKGFQEKRYLLELEEGSQTILTIILLEKNHLALT